MKILSLVIPAYNSEKFLDKCIQSMLHPDVLQDIEIIVVNDGSTDRTPEIAVSYDEQYPDTVRLINQENKGHGGALNTGCVAASGKYLKVIDADDWVVTKHLPSFIQKLSECESDVVLTPHHTIDISSGEVCDWKCYPPEYGRTYTFSEIMQDWGAYERSLTFHGITYRTDFYREKAEPLPEHVFYEDHVYATFPCCYAESITPMDLFIYEYRIGDCSQSVSRQNQLKRHVHMETVLKVMEQRYAEMSDSPNRMYVGKKIECVLLSYFVTTLLADPDRKEGRVLARRELERCKASAPRVASALEKKYMIFLFMNRLHMTDVTWGRILESSLYKHAMRKRSFS